MNISLYVYKSKGLITLIDAFSNFCTALEAHKKGEERAFALLYTPHRCYLALAQRDANRDAKFFSANGEIKDVDVVFEARIFNAVAELRWLNVQNGRGKAVVLSETGDLKCLQEEPSPEKNIIGQLRQCYYLWGKSAKPSSNGWTPFATARIGAFDVPLDGLSKGDRAQFIAHEYLKEYDDGNVAVAEERLVGIEATK